MKTATMKRREKKQNDSFANPIPMREAPHSQSQTTATRVAAGVPEIVGTVQAFHSRSVPDGVGGRIECTRLCMDGRLKSGELNEFTLTNEALESLGISLADTVRIRIEKA